MNWRMSQKVDLSNNRIAVMDADRQMKTAEEILRRFDRCPGVILADEVGMGKTYVALAVAVSVIEATGGNRPVVVMMPPGVQQKWPRDWQVFQELCLTGPSDIRATHESINRGAAFLKLLDDPAPRRNHLIFLTHGALTSSLRDPLVRLALIRQAFLRRTSLSAQRRAFPRWAGRLLNEPTLTNRTLVEELLESNLRRWRGVYRRYTGKRLEDDPVPEALVSALRVVDLTRVVAALVELPLRESRHLGQRLSALRGEIQDSLNGLWSACLHQVDLHLPLLILDEAHHLKNPRTRFASLFASPKAAGDAKLLQGPLAQVFDRMLFLTATPFQLGHQELVQVLRRFGGVRWGDGLRRQSYEAEIDEVERRLNTAQAAAIRLDRVWGRLRSQDLPAGSWWTGAMEEGPAQSALAVAQEVEQKMADAAEALRPWVIRHARPDRDKRRQVLVGASILDADTQGGLTVERSAVLPFLLAARAQAVVAAEGQRYGAHTRAYFAEGLASSFEAYRQTRLQRDPNELLDDAAAEDGDRLSEQARWYLRHIDGALPEGDASVYGEHPKVEATVRRVVDLWDSGEKVLVFCFYRATGRALRYHISRAIDEVIVRRGAEMLGMRPQDEAAVRRQLELRSERFFDPDAPVTKLARHRINRIFHRVPDLNDEDRNRGAAIALRFLRTPSFLVRYVDLAAEDRERALREAFLQKDRSGASLASKVRAFASFASDRVEAERRELFDALEDLQTGSIFGEVSAVFDRGELMSGGARARERLLPNVRLANGEVNRATRHRLMIGFNTPFFPEVLVASSVMAEGVDLHLDCRYVIHHDLDWNPSVLEQRTGRLDRLGSKAESTRKPIVVYEPFLEATQDEKQFRVVKDRERWFNVVMGERLQLDEWSTERTSERVPLPRQLAERLTMRLALD